MSCDCSNANKCIKCTVSDCKYHCDSKDYCSLDTITVGTHTSTSNGTHTDCKSFESL